MLFNSYIFILAYLPVVVLVYFVLGRRSYHAAILWLVSSSLFFYGWWNPKYLLLILGSIGVNFGLSQWMQIQSQPAVRKSLMVAGVCLNLVLLIYFKYTNFLIDSFNQVSGQDIVLQKIVLPLGISFFTFQQIAYIVDSWRENSHETSFTRYCLFVTFFPHLIAGPLVHHREMLAQFSRPDVFLPRVSNFVIGATIFSIGLFKKSFLADGVALFTSPVFAAAEQQGYLHASDAWGGALGYTLQVYFDFSGYSDMAIGLARLFGVLLPLNFHSPYKSASIIDFWRRWHMTLSRFLRNYLYYGLGGNRHGKLIRYRNLWLTMLLGGIWHGASWNFAVWGALHGFYLIVNHAWRAAVPHLHVPQLPRVITHGAGVLLTFVSVMVGLVFFRAESIHAATHILLAMCDIHDGGVENVQSAARMLDGKDFRWCAVLLAFCWWLPNTQEIMREQHPALDAEEHLAAHSGEAGVLWKPNARWAIGVALLAVIAFFSLSRASEFLYFQF